MAKRKSSFWIRGILLLLILFLPALLDAKPIPFKSDHPRLIETGELAGSTDHPSLRIIDMRTSLLDYLKGHIPDTVYLSLEVLCVPKSGIPAQAPDRIYIEKVLGEYLSVSNDMVVALYSERSNPNATYLAWTLDYLGHKRMRPSQRGLGKMGIRKASHDPGIPGPRSQEVFRESPAGNGGRKKVDPGPFKQPRGGHHRRPFSKTVQW